MYFLSTLALFVAAVTAQAGNGAGGDGGTSPLATTLGPTTIVGSTVLSNTNAGSTVLQTTMVSGMTVTGTTTIPRSTTAVLLMSGSTTLTVHQTSNPANVIVPTRGDSWYVAAAGAVAMAVGAF